MREGMKPSDSLPWVEKAIDQERIWSWARLSGDFNRLHVDPEYARQTRFKGAIAHGPMSLAFLNELMMRCFDEAWPQGGRLTDVRFVAPIRPGDRIRIGGTVMEISEKDGEEWVECEVFIEKDGGEKAVIGRAMCRLKGREAR